MLLALLPFSFFPAGVESRYTYLASLPFALLLASAYTAWDTFRSNGNQHGLAPRYLYGAVPVEVPVLELDTDREGVLGGGRGGHGRSILRWRRGDERRRSARAVPHRRQLARLPGVLRAPRVDRDLGRASHERDLRLRVDAREAADRPRRAADRRRLGRRLERPPRVGSDTIVTAADSSHQAGPVHRFFFGSGYRDLWTKPIRIPAQETVSFAIGSDLRSLLNRVSK